MNLIIKRNNPGCKKCKFQVNRDNYIDSLCKIKYKDWNEDPILEKCINANINGECTSFKPTLGYRISSFFNGNWCVPFGHSMYFIEGTNIAGPTKCKRCGHIEPGVKWPGPSMPEVKSPKEDKENYE